MPDFSAISKALGGANDILKGIMGAFGSIAGDGFDDAIGGIMGLSSDATA